MKTPNVTVRKAKIESDDMTKLLIMGKEFFDSSGLQEDGAVYDAKSMASNFLSFLNNPKSVIFIAEYEAKPIGMVAVSLIPAIYNSSQSVVGEFGWWIDEKHRFGSTIKQLVSAVRNWASNHKSPWIHLHICNNGHKRFTMRNMMKRELTCRQPHYQE